MPSSGGTTLIVGMTLEGQWVAEYRCYTADFDERSVRAMEREVLKKEAASLRLVK